MTEPVKIPFSWKSAMERAWNNYAQLEGLAPTRRESLINYHSMSLFGENRTRNSFGFLHGDAKVIADHLKRFDIHTTARLYPTVGIDEIDLHLEQRGYAQKFADFEAYIEKTAQELKQDMPRSRINLNELVSNCGLVRDRELGNLVKIGL